MVYANKPTLVQTETEYLLFIHPAEKERAKVIGGHRWDPGRRCWVYPRTKRVFDALYAEFGDQLVRQIQSEPPQPAASEPQPDYAALNERLLAENEKLKTMVVELSSKSSAPQAELQHLRQEAALRDSQLTELHQQIAQLQEQLAGARREADRLRAELNSHDNGSSCERRMKYLAIQATGNDEAFAELLEQVSIDDRLPFRLANQLEAQLRGLMKVPDDERADLYDLLQQVRETEVLPQDALDLAHLVRKQRNIIAHSDPEEHTCQARAIICLFAAALLWPEFKEV